MMRIAFVIIVINFLACTSKNITTQVPQWSKNLILYELMPWHNSTVKNLDSIALDIPRIRNNFFNGIVFHPVQVRDIGDNGFNPNSPFSISDFAKVDEQLGGKKAFRRLLDTCKHYNIKTFIQWDFTQTGPHHEWRTKYPEFYKSNETIVDGRYNKDYISLNLENAECRKRQLDIFRHFIEGYPVDGVVFYGLEELSVDFCQLIFNEAMGLRQLLLINNSDKVIPPFHYHTRQGFFHLADRLYNDHVDVSAVQSYIDSCLIWPTVNGLMTYAINESKGTDYNLFQNAYKYYVMLSYMIEGIPWVLNGQEYGLLEPLSVFTNKPFGRVYNFNSDLYRSLNLQKITNRALWSIPAAGKSKIISDSKDVLALERRNGDQYCVGLFNLRAIESTVILNQSYHNAYDLFNKIPVIYPQDRELKLGPYQAVLFSNVP